MSSQSLKWLATIVFCALLPACGPNAGTFVEVDFRPGPSTPTSISRIDLQVTLAGKTAMTSFDKGGAEIMLPTTAILDVRSGSGPITITATARDSQNTMLDEGTGTGDVVRDQKTSVTVQFGGGGLDAGEDSAAGGDFALNGDLAGDLNSPLAHLSLSKATFDFGTLLTGTTSSATSVMLTNDGLESSGVISANFSGADAASFALVGDGCSGMTLVPGASCTFGVTVTPTAVGTPGATLTFMAAPGGSPSVSLSATAVAPGALAAMPMSKDFMGVVLSLQASPQPFVIKNTGGVNTGALTAAHLSGTDTNQFSISSDGCNGMTLTPAGTCTVSVLFAPTTAGAKTAAVSVDATPGGTAVASLSGTGLNGATLDIVPTTATAFSTMDVSSPTGTVTYTITNNGDVPTAAVVTTPTGNTGDFIVTDSCNGLTQLGAHQACTLVFAFKPTAYGNKSATYTVSAGGLMAQAMVTGTGRDQLALTVTATGTGSFSVTMPGAGSVTGTPISCSTSCIKQYYRTTVASPSVQLTENNATGTDFAGWSGGGGAGSCSGTTCAVTLGPTSVTASFALQTFGLTVTKSNVGGADGTITSQNGLAPAINCGGNCSQTYNYNQSVTLTATPNSNFYFAGWTGPDACAGTSNVCAVTMTAARSLTAKFSPANKMFVTSARHVIGSLGGLSGANTICQTAAASLGGTWKAALAIEPISGAAAEPIWDQMRSARGWVRTDGKPFADTFGYAQNQAPYYIFYPPVLDETGAVLPLQEASGNLMSGYAGWATGVGGANLREGDPGTGVTCSNWTTTTGNFESGGIQVAASEGNWMLNAFEPETCTTSAHVLCFQVDYSAIVKPPPPPTNRIAFVSNNHLMVSAGGIATLDSLCQSDAATAGFADSANFVGFVGTSTASPISRLTNSGNANGPWYRPDGVAIVAQESDLLGWTASSRLTAALDVQPGGALYDFYVNTGELNNPTQQGANNCTDWTTSDSTKANVGVSYSLITDAWGFGGQVFLCSGMSSTVQTNFYCFHK